MPRWQDPSLVWRTVRHLQLRQVAARAVRLAGLRRYRRASADAGARIDENAIRSVGATVRQWGPGDLAQRTASARRISRGEYRFLNEELRATGDPWAMRGPSQLWQFHLHYHDFVLDLAWAAVNGDEDAEHGMYRLVESWLAAGGGDGAEAWHPYPTSVRLVNWVYALGLLWSRAPVEWRGRMAQAIGGHLRYLNRRLEYDVAANHLARNYKALYVASGVLSGTHWAKVNEEAARGLQRELTEQMLADGVHFERSPMYHALFLADYLEVAQIETALGRAQLGKAGAVLLIRACEALNRFRRPDGTLHLFNDTANGVVPPPAWFHASAGHALNWTPAEEVDGTWSLPEGGYFGFVNRARGERFILDAGEPGAPYQPAHAHCDVGSFELDLDGRPVVVDSGVGGYCDHWLREYCRSTRAHNTVVIGGEDQSEIWGCFRMARRSKVLEVGTEEEEGGAFAVRCAVRPYFDQQVVHRRRVTRSADGCWHVIDGVEGALGGELKTIVHFHPDLEVRSVDGKILIESAELRLFVEPINVDDIAIVCGEREPVPQGWYCERFGQEEAAATLELSVRENDGRSFGYRIIRGDEGRGRPAGRP